MVTKATSLRRGKLKLNRIRAQGMRHVPTDAENKFWRQVRARRLREHKFKRQVLIGSYIVDFVCIERRLVVELDGGQHDLNKGYDQARNSFLAFKGFRVLRFWNDEVLRNMDGVVEGVLRALDEKPPSP